MRIFAIALVTAALSVALSLPSRAQPGAFEGQCWGANRGSLCDIYGGGVYRGDPYGLDRFQAAQHNSCVTDCDSRRRTCLMTYLEQPDPYPLCDRVQAACLQRCR
jgi:hypothetical protein